MKGKCFYKMEKSGRTLAGFMAIVIVLCALCAGEIILSRFLSEPTLEAVVQTENQFTIVIDAGHGGMDGGAVGAGGELEKDYNLAVAQRLEKLCEMFDVECVMTRSEDRMVVDDSVTKKRKMHDLKNRVALTESIEMPIFVSIHMNNFPDRRYSGLQVWYSKNNERSSSLAALIQTYARTFLDETNQRETKEVTSSIFVLDRLNVPAVLVECGFMSNAEECKKLGTDEYQTELAMVIFAAVCEFMWG